MRIERIGDAELFLGDCRDILPTLGKVDAVVTSPPYDGMREYGTKGSAPIDCIPLIADSVTLGGVVVWNVADQVIDGSESGTSFRQALTFMATLRLHDTMIYCKEGVTFPDANRYHPAFEYMFVFSNGSPRHFNGIKDWKNKWGGGFPMHGTDRQPNGDVTPINGMGRPVLTYGLRRNWWVIGNPYKGETDGHPAPMPYSMATDHITTWTESGEVILDPYLGSGTTGVACAKLGRKFIGIEIEPKYFDIACRRVEEASRQRDLFVSASEGPMPVNQLDTVTR